MNLLKWILFPGAMVVLRMGGDDGGGGGSGSNTEAEEGRKTNLRKRIDKMYGIGEQVPIYGEAPQVAVDPETGAPMGMASSGERSITGYQDDPEAAAARQSMEGENTKLADATRGYYTDQLGRDYAKAERNTRFKLARQGLSGGSEDIFQQGEVNSDRDLGATRVDEAVRRAVAGLKTQREQERLSAVNLVNSGAGDSAVSAAQAGLHNTLANASNASKADLFTDLFSNSADAVGTSNASAQAALLGQRYRDRLATFYPATGTTSGRVTPTS